MEVLPYVYVFFYNLDNQILKNNFAMFYAQRYSLFLKVKSSILLMLSFHFLQAQPLEQTSFESFADEAVYDLSSWTAEGFSVPWVNGFNQTRAHIDNAYSHSGSKSLRIFFPQGQYGPSGSGAQAPLMVPAASQYYISYWLRFSDNFSWGTTSEGGKLPGLAGGSRCSGCATCTGSNGFSARLMWRPGGKAVLYLYHMDKANSCGDNLNLQLTPGVDFVFQKGQWYQIIERVKINTGNNFDGEVQLWINQQPALSVSGKRFVNNGDQVDALYFSTFHGGSDATWAPTVDCYIWFDDLMITSNPADIFTTLGFADKNNQGKNSSIKSNVEVKIYPQPMKAGEFFSMEQISSGDAITSIEWMDVYGRSINYRNAEQLSGQYPVPDLEKGFYILKIQLSEGMVFQKVYVE